MSEWHTGWTEGYASARSEAQAEIGNLQAKCEMIYDELLEAKKQIARLQTALKQFATPDWCEYATLPAMICAAATALKETGDE